MKKNSSPLFAALAFIGVGCVVATALLGAQAPPPGTPSAKPPIGQTSANPRVFLDTYCITCHNQKLRTAGLAEYESVRPGPLVGSRVVRMWTLTPAGQVIRLLAWAGAATRSA